MNLIFHRLKTKYFPELNVKPIGIDRIIQVFNRIDVRFFRLPMEGKGAYVVDAADKSEYVFINDAIRNLLEHETIAFEGVHALGHVPAATFLKSKHDLEAEVLSLIIMIPATDLPRLNRIKHHLDDEGYDYLMKRNKVNKTWNL